MNEQELESWNEVLIECRKIDEQLKCGSTTEEHHIDCNRNNNKFTNIVTVMPIKHRELHSSIWNYFKSRGISFDVHKGRSKNLLSIMFSLLMKEGLVTFNFETVEYDFSKLEDIKFNDISGW